jgi:hypothetical protein
MAVSLVMASESLVAQFTLILSVIGGHLAHGIYRVEQAANFKIQLLGTGQVHIRDCAFAI